MNYIEQIERLTEEMAVDAGRNLDAPVAACPMWTTGQLVDHVASVQRFWAMVVRMRVTDRSSIEQPSPRPVDADPITWLRAASADFAVALSGCPIDERLWTWWRRSNRPASSGDANSTRLPCTGLMRGKRLVIRALFQPTSPAWGSTNSSRS